MSRRFRHLMSLVLTAFVVVAGIVTPAAWGLEIVDARWGFDGKIQRNRFNVLSVLVDNPRPEPFDGELWLRKRMSGGSPIDARMVESVFVGPFARRWVQFYPYVGDAWESFGLIERDARGNRSPERELISPKIGWPARVIINSTAAGERPAPVKSLPDVLFPPFVTATDGLQAVLLDSVPNWDEPRRQAFLNWLYRGGTAYVLKSASGDFPDFPTSLGVLADPLDEAMYGGGRIFRVHRARRDLTPELLAELFQTLPKRLRTQQDGTVVEDAAVDDSSEGNVPGSSFADGSDPLSASSFLTRLKRMTRPNHNWPLLHLMFWLYIALVFPGCWLIGRRWSDYRLVYAALLGTVALFSVLFALVGQRGYGEATAVNSVAFIRPLPNGMADVSQWSNAFVTSGGDYEIRHQGSGTLYSTCNFSEEVNGVIQNGADARFTVDIPPFSSREFAHRIQLPLAFPQFEVADVTFDGDRLATLTIHTNPPLPVAAENLSLLHGKRFYAINRQGAELKLGSRLGEALGYLRVAEFDSWQYQYGPRWGAEERSAQDQFHDLFTPMLSRSLNVSREADAAALALPPNQVRLFYFTELPRELHAENPYLGKQDGYALFVIDLPLEAAPP